MGSDAARKRPNIPSKFLNSSTTVLKGQPLPESPLILCNKDKAAIKLTTMNHPHSTNHHHHHDHNRRRRRRHNNNNNNNNNDNNNQHNNNNNKKTSRNVRRPAFIFQIDRRRRCVTRPTRFISSAGHSSIQAEINMPTAGQLRFRFKTILHFSIFAPLNNHQQQLDFQQQTQEKPSFGAHIVEAVHLFSSKSARPWSIGNAIDIPMHVVYISGQQLS
ncbi:hypothetical protein T12_9054 [Trichinella patagoniensis]|uniref:Uncharacterized protein n=1 Tax=Trichinella patagoniensis TaxID=990121 RepID=A0A0V1AFL2_9BILA|nr:hypothetical protein T12_9054 [Trichinella patagoniensis]